MRIRAFLLPAALLGAASVVIAHTDDPKAKDFQPIYQGPGYRAAEGGIAGGGFGAQDISLMSWLPVEDFGAQDWANDCWGYTSPSGREYAILGLSDGTSFVEITDPADAQILVTHWGPNSTWRDIKIYQHYAYAVSEAGEGIQVFDLSDIDNGGVTALQNVTDGGTEASHNVAIDETSGFLYRCGGGGNGLRMYDLADPENPVYVATWPDRYVHDAQIVTYTEGPYAGRQIAFCCGGFNGGSVDTGLDIVDVTDKDNIFLVERLLYPDNEYSHQGWLSDDRQYFYLNDELNADQTGTSTTHVIDVSDIENPFLATTITNGNPAITHNLYVKEDRLYAANYTSGMRVFDISDPLNAYESAYFDTRPEDDNTNFNGLWSVYPFFPSGTIIGSDRQRGLFVWSTDTTVVGYSYPNGRPELLDPAGDEVLVQIDVADGGLVEGTAMMTYTTEGVPTEVPLESLGDGLFAATFPAFECPTAVSYYFSVQSESGATWADPGDAPLGQFSAVAALGQEIPFTDDFEDDLGWSVTNGPGLEDGAWEKGVPVGGGDRGDPAADYDGSGQCFLTDNVDGNSDVDGGATTLTSPVMDASGDGDAFLQYAWWYTNDVGQNGDEDTMLVEISNDGGASWQDLDVIENSSGWHPVEWLISDHLAATDQMRVRFTASDFGGGSVVEAGVDDVSVVFYDCGGDPGVPGDVNGDGEVNVEDLVAVITAWGPCGSDCDADLNGDGAVDVQDLIFVITNWS